MQGLHCWMFMQLHHASSSNGRLHCNISNSGGVLLVTFPYKATRFLFAIQTCCFIKVCQIHIAKEQQITKRLSCNFKTKSKRLLLEYHSALPPPKYLPSSLCFFASPLWWPMSRLRTTSETLISESHRRSWIRWCGCSSRRWVVRPPPRAATRGNQAAEPSLGWGFP